MILLLFFLFSVLLLGSFHIGGFSVRVIASIAMMAFLFLRSRKANYLPLKKKPILIYTAFLLITFLSKELSSNLSGVDEVSPFATRLSAYFLLCYIAYISIDRIAISVTDIKKILILLCGICVIDDVVTYLQYSGNSIGTGLGMMFSTSEGDYLRKVAENLDRLDEIQIAMPGVFGHGAVNGYMVSTLGILTVYYLVGNGWKYWKFGVVLFTLALLGAFSCQERSGFGLLLLFALISIWKFSARFFKFSVPLFLLLFIISNYDSLVDLLLTQDIGRYSELTKFDNNRAMLLKNALDFIQDHLLLGGDVLYGSIYGLTPHNVIPHAFIYSGVFGAIVVLYLTFYMLRDAYRIIKASTAGTMSYFFACALTIYLLNGFFHSSSLITGDVIIWILYASMLRSHQLEIESR